MKKQLFTLLTLLVMCVMGAWADDTYYTPDADEVIILTNVYDKDASTANYSKHAGVLFYANNASFSSKTVGDPDDNAKTLSGNSLAAKNNGDSKRVTLNITSVSKLTVYHNNDSKGCIRILDLNNSSAVLQTGSKGVSYSEFELDGTKSYSIRLEGYGDKSSDNATQTQRDVYVYAVKLTKYGSSKTTLAGGWTNASPSFIVGSSATIPTFSVTGGGELGTDYTVAYSEVSDANNIVTTEASNGITAISTSAEGTATIRATVALTETGAESYSLETTTYDITITVSNVVTLFSMTSITGPTSDVGPQAKADVTATFSAGGSAEVYNAHSSNNATMVTNNTIYLTSSGNSYCHVMFPTKLQAGDVIALGETTGNAYISTTDSKGSTKYTVPYTIPAESGFIGATDVYIFNNKDNNDDLKVASFNTFTISGIGVASDLNITSSKKVTISVGGTSNITYTSSNNNDVTYSSNATGVATVTDAGVITAVAPGTAVITISQASDGTIRAAAAKVTVTVERSRIPTEVTGEYVLDTTNGVIDGTPKYYISKDGSVVLEGGIDTGSNTYNDLKNSHFKHNSNITFTLPTNYPVSSVWFVGYNNSQDGTTTIKLKKVDGEDVTEQSGTIGGSGAIPAADCVGFVLEAAATESMVINFSGQSRGYFILNPEAQNITMTQVGKNYYASYYSAGEMTITGATAYTAELDKENSKLVLTECANGVVGGRTGVILIGNSTSATATPSFTGAAKGQGALIGAAQKEVAMVSYYAGNTSAANKVFVLGVNDGKAGLYKYTGTSLGVNKAYLYDETLAPTGPARSLEFDFGGETTSVNGVSADTVKVELKKFFENGQLFINKNGEKFNAAGQQVK